MHGHHEGGKTGRIVPRGSQRGGTSRPFSSCSKTALGKRFTACFPFSSSAHRLLSSVGHGSKAGGHDRQQTPTLRRNLGCRTAPPGTPISGWDVCTQLFLSVLPETGTLTHLLKAAFTAMDGADPQGKHAHPHTRTDSSLDKAHTIRCRRSLDFSLILEK